MDAAELAMFIKVAAELLVALKAFTEIAERVYPLATRRALNPHPPKDA